MSPGPTDLRFKNKGFFSHLLKTPDGHLRELVYLLYHAASDNKWPKMWGHRGGQHVLDKLYSVNFY